MSVLKSKKYSKVEIILLCICLTILSTFILNLGSLIIILLPKANSLNILGVGLSMIIGFIIIPTKLLKYILGIDYKIFNIINFKRYIIYTIIIYILLLLYSFNLEEVTHPFIVATCEEYLFRGLIFGLLLNKFSKIKAILIGSIIFSFLLHLNGNILENFLTKFPTSIILYLIKDKIGLQEAIVVHWLYNYFIVRILE